MATSKNQRIGILVILVVTVVGTLGSFFVMILANENQATDSARQQAVLKSYQTASDEYKKKVDAQAAELSALYYPTLSQHASRVGTFDAENVKALGSEDILIGTGEEITGTTKFAAYYVGWNPKGKIFDQSIEGDTLKAPYSFASGLENGGVIEGWQQGIKGMKIGGVRELTIPSDLAYKDQDKGDDIPPNTPLKFLVMVISLPEQIPQPEVPAELYQGLQ